MYFGIASNDDMRQPDAKDKLKEAFAAAKVPAEIEVYPEPCTAGACRTCRCRTARRSTTSPMPSAPGASWSRCTRWRSPDQEPFAAPVPSSQSCWSVPCDWSCVVLGAWSYSSKPATSGDRGTEGTRTKAQRTKADVPRQSDTGALSVRMKIDPPDTAIDASVAPSSVLVASLRNTFPAR